MKIFCLVVIFFSKTDGKVPDHEKREFCDNLTCGEDDNKVCGVRYEEDEVIFRLFDNECQLMLYGCQVDDNETFGIISMDHCSEPTYTSDIEHVDSTDACPNCVNVTEQPVCGIRRYGEGFRVRTFDNKCQLRKHNCDYDLNFTIAEYFICLYNPENEEINDTEEINDGEVEVAPEQTKPEKVQKTNNVVVVHGSGFDARNINQSIAKFFAATHRSQLRLKEVHSMLNESARKMLLRIFGPAKVFTPFIVIPKNISEDYWHIPTLSSCFHKCPTKCPDTYAPVCGSPGTDVRDPALMFQNHCYMDAAQCKTIWVNEYYSGATYVEQAFVFCLGDELNGMARFFPFIRTLQRLGRIKPKGYFRYRIKNMKWFNNHMDLKWPRFNG
uniref:Kazal-like domain-containing protein n=1 Tax=Heliothis virescens TaxID=7102 RepID=A0A2A4JGL7_HELVI